LKVKPSLGYTGAMPKTGLTPAAIRDKAIEVTVERMRRHGFDKVRLVDIAKDLGVSHAALYTHFADRGALLDAVSERWLNALESSLEAICRKEKDPIAKIHEWFQRLHRTKRDKFSNDPEPYKSFHVGAEGLKPFYTSHLARVHRQLAHMVGEAVTEKKLTRYSIDRTVSLLFETTTAFHNPKLVAQHVHEKREPLLKQVLNVAIDGLS
jgi:AcrR family transcriptional regulator